MRVFEAKFNGVWLGGVAVIVAQDEEQAAQLLRSKLENDGLLIEQTDESIKIREVDADTPDCRILFDGDY